MVLDLCHGYKEYSFSMCFFQLVTQMCRSMDTWIGFLEVVMKQTDYQSTLSVFMVSGYPPVGDICLLYTHCPRDTTVLHLRPSSGAHAWALKISVSSTDIT